MSLRIHTSSDIDPYGLGRWLVSEGERTWFRGTMFECLDWRSEQDVAVEREQCELHGSDCEIFTQCVKIEVGEVALTACPTCAVG
jgi:hypothetical protein